MNAGVDMAMYWSVGSAILQDVNLAIQMSRINEAVGRTPRRSSSGWSDQPCVKQPEHAVRRRQRRQRGRLPRSYWHAPALRRSHDLAASRTTRCRSPPPRSSSPAERRTMKPARRLESAAAGRACSAPAMSAAWARPIIFRWYYRPEGPSGWDPMSFLLPDQVIAVAVAASADAIVVAVGERRTQRTGDNRVPVAAGREGPDHRRSG